jgi:hypothetical protein
VSLKIKIVVAAKFIGPRAGRFAPKVKNGLENHHHHQHIPGHSIPVNNLKQTLIISLYNLI